MRFLISGGGTGGHVYPALAAVAQLPQALATIDGAKDPGNSSQAEIQWVGSLDGLERELVERAGLTFTGLPTGQIRGVKPLTALQNTGKMIRGAGEALALVRRFQPHVCFVTGGYVSGPVAMACWVARVPILIYLPDMIPGMAIRLLSRLAQRVAVSFPAAATHFPGKAVVTGYPVRAELVTTAQNRGQARRQLADRLGMELGSAPTPLLLVTGGSRGARSINQAIQANLAQLLPLAQILHITGTLDYQRVQDERLGLPQEWQERYHVMAYLHEEMALALAGSDLCVCRAGASILGEMPVARLPSILVPYPYSGAHQWPNAEQLTIHGGALAVADGELDQKLLPALLSLLQEPARRREMEETLAGLAQPLASLNLAREIVQLGIQ